MRIPTPIAGLERIERQPRADARGRFERLFCAEELREVFDGRPVAQINGSSTTDPGTVRGLHWQRDPHGEHKLVTCIAGRVFDVVVDVRPESPTFLVSYTVELDADEPVSICIPPGCAHGFQALAEESRLLYVHSSAHRVDSEATLHVLDPRLAIPWPLPVRGLSPRDAGAAFLAADLLEVARGIG
ncbi:MAG: hypothetical protein GC161_05400 [Planctomycetaceae bacterium]|nr:hypothetical protein [Planctomycetaceae bacterium]